MPRIRITDLPKAQRGLDRNVSESTRVPLNVLPLDVLEAQRRAEMIQEVTKNAQIGQGHRETKKEKADRVRRNTQYTYAHPYAKIDETGNIQKTNPNRTLENSRIFLISLRHLVKIN